LARESELARAILKGLVDVGISYNLTADFEPFLKQIFVKVVIFWLR
jgi:hypothetical protein